MYVAGSREPVARLPVRLPPRLGVLAGREQLLADIHAVLTGGNQPPPRAVVLSGLGGVGKSSVAAEYAHRHLAELGVAWQLAAEDGAVLALEMAELAAQLGGRDMADLRDPVASAHAVLAAWPAEWLLVFDNAPDEPSVRRFLPPTGRGRVVITSQSQHWQGLPLLDVEVLDTRTAAGFLVDRTGDPDLAAAAALARELGGLPLALEQAAAYIRATGDTSARYLNVFRDRRAELLSRGEAAGHPLSVAATFELALSRLDVEAPPAVVLLRLLACLAPEPVPLDLLLASSGFAGDIPGAVSGTVVPLLSDYVAARDAVAALRRFSLITLAGNGLVLMHRLVRAITLDLMSPDQAKSFRHAAAVLTEAAIPGQVAMPNTWPACAALLPHVRAILNLTSGGMRQIALYLSHSGSYAAARDLFSQISDAHEQSADYGPEHPDTLSTRAKLADSTGDAGDAAAARDLFAALLATRSQVLGAEHPDTLSDRASLAYFTGRAGDAPAARDQYAALLPARTKVSGAEHPDTLSDRANLARWTGNAGDAAAARDQLAALLPVLERVLGAEDRETLTGRSNLAFYTGVAGNAAATRDQLAALLPILEKVLGAEHPETLSGRVNLARWTGEAGDAAAARDQCTALVPITERVLGAEHPATLTGRVNLAYFTAAAGDEAAALDQFAALLPVLQKVLGAEHPDTLINRVNFAFWTGKAGNAPAARDQYVTVLPVLEKVFGADHPDALNGRATLASFTGQAGDAAAARDQLATVLPVFEKVFGAEHPRTLTVGEQLAYWRGEATQSAR
jgi:hypothetical protein